MRILYILLVFTLLLATVITPLDLHAAGTLENIGFIQRNIWYSKDPFFEGDTITIYTVVFNSGSETVAGVVEFYDKNVILGKQDFTVEPGTFKNLSIDWNVLAGDRTISAQIVNSEILLSGGEKESIILEHNKTEEDKRFVPKSITSEEGSLLGEELSETVEDVQEFLKEKIPDVVEEKIASATTSIEEWREKTGESLKEKAEEIKKELEEIKKNSEPTTSDKADEVEIKDKLGPENKLQTPFTYAKLWFLKLLSFIFAHKLLFYGVTVLLIFFILRFIWRRIF